MEAAAYFLEKIAYKLCCFSYLYFRRCKTELKGYRRPDGRVGFRNHVLILPTVICSYSVARKICDSVPGTVTLPIDSGCAMLEEDINLAYHGMRALDSSFNIKIEKDLDQSIGKLDVVPQDVSRVFLNIISNGCYEAFRKKLKEDSRFSPVLWVTTQGHTDHIEIRIRDNGNGIPEKIRDKMFTPFFTTKPAGMGTGLGLSISYDIIVHGHNGQLLFETEEGEFTEFILTLPK